MKKNYISPLCEDVQMDRLMVDYLVMESVSTQQEVVGD